MPLPPAANLTTRIAEVITTVLAAHSTPTPVLDQERRHMQTCQLGTTTNRSVVGVMTEFARFAEFHHDHDPDTDLVELALRLAATLCSPLYGGTSAPTVNWPPSCARLRPSWTPHSAHRQPGRPPTALDLSVGSARR
jgi:hypothetical protein